MEQSVKIYQPVKNPMQSGTAKDSWVVEYVAPDARFIEPLMGWTGSRDTTQQLRLKFKTKEEAIAYATRKGLDYELILPNPRKTIIQSYAANFVKK